MSTMPKCAGVIKGSCLLGPYIREHYAVTRVQSYSEI